MGRPPSKIKLQPLTIRLTQKILGRLPTAGNGARAKFIREAIEEKLNRQD